LQVLEQSPAPNILKPNVVKGAHTTVGRQMMAHRLAALPLGDVLRNPRAPVRLPKRAKQLAHGIKSVQVRVHKPDYSTSTKLFLLPPNDARPRTIRLA